MADRTLVVRPGTFSANSKVYSAGPEGLAAQLRNLLAVDASRTAIAGATVDFSMADSSGAVGRSIITGDATGGAYESMLTLVGGELGVPTGHPVELAGADLPAPLAANTVYYVVRLRGESQIFRVAASQKDAESGNFITLTDDGSGTQWIKRQIVLPPAFAEADVTGATTGVLDTQVAATLDTLLEALASARNVLNPMAVDLGITAPTIGTLTGAVDTVAVIDVTATANTDNDDAAPFADLVVAADEVNDAIKTVAGFVNDLSAAVGVDEYLDFVTPQHGVEGSGFDASSGATGAVGSAASTVLLTEFNAALVVWRAAVGHILQRVSVVSADAQGTAPEDWTHQLVPSATEIPQVKQGLRTRGRP